VKPFVASLDGLFLVSGLLIVLSFETIIIANFLSENL